MLTWSCLVIVSMFTEPPCGDWSIKPWGSCPTRIWPRLGEKIGVTALDCTCNWFNNACRLAGLSARGAVKAIGSCWVIDAEDVLVRFIGRVREEVTTCGRIGVVVPDERDSSDVGVSKFPAAGVSEFGDGIIAEEKDISTSSQ